MVLGSWVWPGTTLNVTGIWGVDQRWWDLSVALFFKQINILKIENVKNRVVILFKVVHFYYKMSFPLEILYAMINTCID